MLKCNSQVRKESTNQRNYIFYEHAVQMTAAEITEEYNKTSKCIIRRQKNTLKQISKRTMLLIN